MLERVIEGALVRGVAARGGRADKVQSPGRRGFFDRIVVMPGGRVFFVELKRPRGGRMSLQQEERAREYRTLGAEVRMLRSLAQVEAFLSQLDEPAKEA